MKVKTNTTGGDRAQRGIAAAVIVLACAGSAFGQNALGDGRALDRNLMVGSGGVNTQVRDLQAQIRFNNAVVTGTAAGGRAFRGDLGYRADTDFGAALGSDTTYTFRRDSAFSAAPMMGIRASDAVRYQFALATGSSLPPQFAGAGGGYLRDMSVSRGSDVDTRVPGGAVRQERAGGAGPMRSTSQFMTERAIRPTVVGFTNDQSGGQYTITASPLLGVNLFKSGQTETEARPAGERDLPAIPGQRVDEKASQTRLPTDRPIVNPLTGFEAGVHQTPSALESFGTANVPMVDSMVRSGVMATNNVEHQRVLDRFEAAYRDRPATGVLEAPGTEPGEQRAGGQTDAQPGAAHMTAMPWEHQLVRTRAALRGEDPVEAIKKFEQERARESTARAAGSTGLSSTGQSSLGAPAASVDEEALKREAEAMARAGSRLGLTPDTLRALRSAGINFEKLDGGLVESRSRAVDQESYQRNMQAAQRFLADGRFFDAEERFARAMASSPMDPMAAIGRVHAQLGGGLYMSASANLRRLMMDHPELLSSTFGEGLVPNAERTARIRGQLLDVLESRRERGNVLGRDAGLLLAYLGHITRDAALTKRGLDEFGRRLTDEEKTDAALLELLRGVWLGS